MKKGTLKYFVPVNTTNSVFIYPNLQGKKVTVTLEELEPDEAHELWHEHKFPFLAITNAGAKKYYGTGKNKLRAEELAMLILKKATCIEDVLALGSLSNTQAVTKAVSRRIEELG